MTEIKKFKLNLFLMAITFVFSFVVLVLSLNFAQATILQGSPFFTLTQQGFGPGQTIEGNINFSLQNQDASTAINARILQIPGKTANMTLLDFLNKSRATITCVPSDCKISYSVSGASEQKTTSLGQEEKYFALMISTQQSNPQILNISFDISGQSSSAGVCGKSPISLDVLDDNSIDWEYKQASDEYCSNPRSSECFDYPQANINSELSTTPSCQKIKLNKTGKLDVSAIVKTNGDNEILFRVYDLNGNIKGNCSTEVYNLEYAQVGCIIGLNEFGEPTNFYLDKEDYYFVCVQKRSGESTVYIKKETQTPICGMYGAPHPQPPDYIFTEDYAIYAAEFKFSPFQELSTFDETTSLNSNLKANIQNYIAAKYNNNCAAGCIIPLKFISNAQQQLDLNSLLLRFNATGSSITTTNLFYDLNVIWPKINMSYQSLPLSVMNLTAPENQQNQNVNYTVKVQLGTFTGQQNFQVSQVPQIISLVPLSVIPGQLTTFIVTAIVPEGRNITQYYWDFGDSSSIITTTFGQVTHTYNTAGSYLITIKAQDNTGMIGSRTFTISSNITKEALNTTINNMLARINLIAIQYNSLESWYKDMLGLNLSYINSTLLSYRYQLSSSLLTDTQLLAMKSSLDSDQMKLPLNITDSLRLLESTYYPNLEEIEPSKIKDITSENYDSNKKEDYQNAITLWQENNIDIKLSSQVKTFVYETSSEDKATIVNIRLQPKSSASLNNIYLIFMLPSGTSYNSIKLSDPNIQKYDLGDAIGISIPSLSSSQTISLAFPGKHNIPDLNFYVSPALSELNVNVAPPICTHNCGKPSLVLPIIVGILVLAIIVFFLIRVWKKGSSSNKEQDLFPNPQDLFNLVNYIQSSYQEGKQKKQIEQELLEAGWSKKQIDYAFKQVKKGKDNENLFNQYYQY